MVQPTRQEVQKYYEPDVWNHMTVSAHGDHIVVTVNGHKTAEVENDPGRRSGHIALQLHGGQDMQVMFKNLKIKTE